MEKTHIPTGPIDAPCVWKGADLQRSDEWIHRLSKPEIAELDRAIRALRESGKPLKDVSAEDFPLTVLAPAIRGWMDTLNTGRGFVLVKGFPVFDYSREDCALAYWLIGRHMGEPVPQNGQGDVLGHVRDVGDDPNAPNTRLYRTHAKQDFHTDGADIIGLFCLRSAKSGGLSRIVGSTTILNEIMRRRPDLVPLLFEPFCFHAHGQESSGQPPYFTHPICAFENGRLRTFYIGWYIRKAQALPGVPPLTPEQIEVLDLIESVAGDSEFYLDMDFEPGDMQFLKNSVTLHARAEYEDWDDDDRKRHLLRLWLTAREFSDGDEFLRRGIPPKHNA